MCISLLFSSCSKRIDLEKILQERVSEGIVPTEAQVKANTPYDRIVIIGVDGVGGQFENADCPNFDKMFSGGSVNYNGISQYPSSSAENWLSMFYGVTYQTFQKESGNNSLHSVLYYLSTIHSDYSFYSAVSWKIINTQILENLDNLTKENTFDVYEDVKDYTYATDVKTCDLAVNRINNHDDKIIFIHFDSVDDAGHKYGGASKQYKEAITEVDKLIGVIYSQYDKLGLLNSTLFICVSDHGHTPEGGHGSPNDTVLEKTTMLAVNGQKGNIINGASMKYVTHDLASILLYALGEVQPDYYEGGVPENLFINL